MRLKEDSHSWRARGIKRRDYRHDFGTPEVPKGHPKRKQRIKKPRTPRHKHIWVEETQYTGWWHERGLPPTPRSCTSFHCTFVGCGKRKYIQNPRAEYEWYKWAKNNGRWYQQITKGR